ncbi:glycoside hydrolase family 2 TIM barrel-domain containing protein [Catenovulum agarivorans]|uniref:glycoside hydrolase family 2 TIM barrel-domain containing protein n=1 Tax=Catenovulum agarivorans TaxID=1172192 RepID=UPI00031D9BC6|nr:glycoside hydrolase family 2 TIM barrel-domain containing protein [Catenovulum agarivorans]
MLRFILAAVLATLSVHSVNAQTQFDSFNFAWQFHRGDINNGQSPQLDTDSWRTVNLPHDYSIEDQPGTSSPFSADSLDAYDTGYTLGGIAWYRKEFVNTNKSGRTVIYFDGIYMLSEIYVNGTKVGGQANGYTGFYIDITEHLYSDQSKNLIAVKVNNPHLNSRWYSGSGIYRPVKLLQLPQNYIAPFAKHYQAVLLSNNNAELKVTLELTNTQADIQATQLDTQIVASNGKVIYQHQQTEFNQQTAQITQSHQLAGIQTWSAAAPNLYTVEQTVTFSNGQQQQLRQKVGFRSIQYSATQGLLINDQPVLLKGMNIHHDHYMLGAASWPDAEYRKLSIIKQAGYNAIRLSHNPPASSLLAAADEIGLYVINESFDSWNKPKWDHKNDYSAHFANDWQRDLSNFIKRDINHPSIIMWSIGNEIPEQVDDLGVATAQKLIQAVTTLDTTRPVTIGANVSDDWADKLLNQFDIVGYNYQEKFYQKDHQRQPNRVMYGSETYPARAFEYWQFVEQHPYIIGDFVWTGWDYLGEASIGWTGYAPEWKGLAPYPWHLAYCGDIDALGNKRPAAYYRDYLWQSDHNGLEVFVKSPQPWLEPTPNPDWILWWTYPDIHPSWTWPNAGTKPLEVTVYTRLAKVDLHLNGQLIASKTISARDEYQAHFQLPYQAGDLTALGYNQQGELVSEKRLTTHKQAHTIKLSAEKTAINADGHSLVYVQAQLFDQNGVPIYHLSQDQQIKFSTTGSGKLMAIGNANPTSTESFQTNTRQSFQGKLVAVIQSKLAGSEDITVTATAAGLRSDSVSIKINR